MDIANCSTFEQNREFLLHFLVCRQRLNLPESIDNMSWLGLYLSRLLPFFFSMDGGGGGRRVGGGVERKVIIRRDYRGELLEDVLLRKKRFCKYHVIENVCNKEKRQD